MVDAIQFVAGLSVGVIVATVVWMLFQYAEWDDMRTPAVLFGFVFGALSFGMWQNYDVWYAWSALAISGIVIVLSAMCNIIELARIERQYEAIPSEYTDDVNQ